ncbi:MAG: hypothetical protein VB997_09065 [Opitutales bacterium]
MQLEHKPRQDKLLAEKHRNRDKYESTQIHMSAETFDQSDKAT